jgi:hypothetical protein
VLLTPRVALEQIAPEPVVKFRRGDRLVQPRSDDEVADVQVCLEEHGRGKQHVVDANDALVVQLDVVEKRRAAVQREVQRVMEVVIEVRASRDHEVDQPAVHHLDDAAAKTGRRQRAGDRQTDGRVMFRSEHLLRIDLARFRQPAGVERLKAFIDQVPDLGTPLRPIIPNRFS